MSVKIRILSVFLMCSIASLCRLPFPPQFAESVAFAQGEYEGSLSASCSIEKTGEGYDATVSVTLTSFTSNVKGVAFRLLDSPNLLHYTGISATLCSAGFLVDANESNNEVRVVILSLSGACIPSGSCAVVEIHYEVDAAAAPGEVIAVNFAQPSVAECGTSRQMLIELIPGECEIPSSCTLETCDGADNDCDGLVDEDEDGDGMDLCWEEIYAPLLDPYSDDADLDADGDGYRNIIEFVAGSDPTSGAALPEYLEATDLVTTPTTDFNMVCLCFEETGFESASDLCGSIAGCQVVSRWAAPRQGYEDYLGGLSFTDYPLIVGQCYFVGITQPSEYVLGGIIPNSVTFDLITTPTTDYNLVSLPYGMFEITMASQLCASIAGCQVVSTWLADNQGYEDYLRGLWFTDFPVEPCMPYFVGVTMDSVWP